MNLKWLHLSDLHLIYNNYDTRVMRRNFLQYLTQKLQNRIDIVFITGDITHQGNIYNDEIYSFLEEILQAVNVEKDNVYMIPGNHDIRRSGLMGTVIQGILSSPNPKEKINTLDEGTFDVLYAGQRNYIEFYEKFLGREYPKNNPHFIIKGNGINVVHINTCLIAGGDDVEGNILVGLNNLFSTLENLENKEETVNFALGHHTINCIHDVEKQSFLNRLSDNFIDFYLNGHVHKTKSHLEANNYNKTYMFTSGASMVDGYSDPVFITGYLNTEEGSGDVKYHSWNVKGEFWHEDNSIDRQTADGSYKFDIEKLKKKEDNQNGTLDDLILDVDESDFKSFLIDFHNIINEKSEEDENFVKKDVTEKFTNMECSKTLSIQYDKFSTLFPIVNNIFNTSSYISFEKKYLVPSLVISEYMDLLHKYNNGDLIFSNMVKKITIDYKEKVHYSEERLKVYISILIYWSIHECDIFNEDKRKKEEALL
ncbi:metallophosphoesterase family protein [Peribacillus frigoritolerans]|uniref:metallophosphoesterase family protein n=1 Tax=Peribacillus frigoritolerans TaxID=450367 RepID=UPI002E1FC827|nr:metallophosphoesterase [Peribacillus frigoritolerans]MED3831933.1 metallophosphoesterase [Peribacillus frigoritolerans]MED3845705.1 metallophosphoesterase [Peribacillus frigoritolerans]